MLFRQGAERLERPLQDPLSSDVDPGAGGHLPEHHQTPALQLVEMLPRRPMRDEVGVGNQHARGHAMRTQDAYRLARLDEERLIVTQVEKAGHQGIEASPVAGGPSRPAVDDELIRLLRVARIQVVAQHPEGRLLVPPSAVQLRSSRRSHRPSLPTPYSELGQKLLPR